MAVGAIPATAAPRPNVLVLLTDDQRAEGTLGVMPATRREFVRKGVSFPSAVTTTPNCCPARASLMTGRYMHNHGVLQNQNNQAQLDQLDRDTLIASRLKQAGYRTGLIGKFLNGWDIADPPPDFDDFAMSPGGVFNTVWNINGEQRAVDEYSTDFVKSQARKMIGRTEKNDRKPWFIYVAFSAPHGTLGPGGVTLEPAPRHEKAEVGELESNPAREERDVAELLDKPPFWRGLAASYEPGPGAPSAGEARVGQLRMLMAVDEAVAGIFDKLRAAGENKRTLAVYTSDNGLFWGEHGGPPVKDMPYAPAVEIPLLIRWDEELERATDPRLAAIIDIVPTLLDAAGIAPGGQIDGRSLLDTWNREKVLLEYSASGSFPTWASLYAPGDEQYTEYYRPNASILFREFTDLAADPFQLENPLADLDPLNDPNVVGMSAELAAARGCAGADCP